MNEENKLKIVRYLVETKKLDVNARDGYEITPLMFAIDFNYPSIGLYLIKKGARVNDCAQVGSYRTLNALSIAAAHPEMGSTLKALIDAGAHVNPKNPDVVAPLYRAVERSNPEAVKILIEAGADMTIKSKDGKSLLEVAKELKNKPERSCDDKEKAKACAEAVYDLLQKHMK